MVFYDSTFHDATAKCRMRTGICRSMYDDDQPSDAVKICDDDVRFNDARGAEFYASFNRYAGSVCDDDSITIHAVIGGMQMMIEKAANDASGGVEDRGAKRSRCQGCRE
jgi:phosphohistidine swiveling domain-containing protein